MMHLSAKPSPQSRGDSKATFSASGVRLVERCDRMIYDLRHELSAVLRRANYSHLDSDDRDDAMSLDRRVIDDAVTELKLVRLLGIEMIKAGSEDI